MPQMISEGKKYLKMYTFIQNDDLLHLSQIIVVIEKQA